MGDQFIFLHAEGMAKLLDPAETSFYRAKVMEGGEKKLEVVKYLTKQKINLLPNKMVRLDQIINFQDDMNKMPKDLQQIAKSASSTPLEMAFFLSQHAQPISWKF